MCSSLQGFEPLDVLRTPFAMLLYAKSKQCRRAPRALRINARQILDIRPETVGNDRKILPEILENYSSTLKQ
jgi:hypothetical protein